MLYRISDIVAAHLNVFDALVEHQVVSYVGSCLIVTSHLHGLLNLDM